jgi:hypothetical protein
MWTIRSTLSVVVRLEITSLMPDQSSLSRWLRTLFEGRLKSQYSVDHDPTESIFMDSVVPSFQLVPPSSRIVKGGLASRI